MLENLNQSEYDFLNKLLLFSNSLIIKNQKRADNNETLESAKRSRDYLLAYSGIDDFYSYPNYTRSELVNAGMRSESEIIAGMKNPNNIAIKYHKVLLDNKRKKIINEYKELNNYYRMLNGLPNVDEDPIKVSSGKYITQLTDTEYFKTYKDEIQELIIKNPELEYLKHLGNKRVNYYEARTAKGFYLLNYEKYIFEEERAKKFIELYYESMVYIISILYTESFKNYEYYDNFVTLLIVFMTIQKFINEQFNYAIRKDFYDLDSIKNTFLSYGLPFYPEIPIKYQQRFIKNINQLLKYKGTNKVLIDIVNLFGFSNIELFKYFLIKDFKRNLDGTPILDGESDIENYELKFAQVPIDDKDISAALQQDYLYQTYEEVTNDDPYWGLDDFETNEIEIDEFKNQLLEAEFNYINTKYLSMNTMFNISQANIETCYFFNLLNTMQSKGLLDDIKFVSNEIKKSGDYARIFDVVTAIFILLYKRFGYDDNIVYTPTAIGSIYGFNFDKDLELLKERILEKSQIKIDGEIIKYDINNLTSQELKILELPIYTDGKENIIDLFFNNKNYSAYLRNLITECNDYREFKALNEIYNYNMYSESIKNLYGNDDIVYTTYTDYLRDNDVELYEYVENNFGTKDGIIKALDALLLSLEIYFNTEKFEYIFTSLTNVSGELVKKYMIKMINIFKAYTVELKKINIYYVFDDKFFNMIKLFSFLKVNLEQEMADFVFKDLYEEARFRIKYHYIERCLENLTDILFRTTNLTINDEELKVIIDKIEKVIFEYDKAESLIENIIDIVQKIINIYKDDYNLISDSLHNTIYNIENDIIFLENIEKDNKLTKNTIMRVASCINKDDFSNINTLNIKISQIVMDDYFEMNTTYIS